MVPEFFKKIDFDKKSADNKNLQSYQVDKGLTIIIEMFDLFDLILYVPSTIFKL